MHAKSVLRMTATALVIAGSAFIVRPASAAVVWSFDQVGADVVGTLSGSLNLTDATPYTYPEYDEDFTAIGPDAAIAYGDQGIAYHYLLSSGPMSFGSGGLTYATGVTGSVFGLDGGALLFYVPVGYVNNSSLSGTITFANATISGLGITPGDYVYSFPGDTITLEFAATPLPATLPLFVTGLGVMGLLGWRRKRKAQAAA
jgi:hypothetical protein